MCPKKHTKLVLIILSCIIILLGLVFYAGLRPKKEVAIKNIQLNGTYLTPAQKINNFHLTDHNGKPFTQNNLKGHWTFVLFGFTNCGMVCPTSMAALSQMYQILQRQIPDNQLPQVVMISVDPDRDSVARMKSYINAFNPHFIGARAPIQETVALENQLHIVATKVQTDEKGKDHYTINHTADVLLFNPKGELQALLSYPHEAKELAKEYLLILGFGDH